MDPRDVAPGDWAAARARSAGVAAAWRGAPDRQALVDAIAGASLPIARDRALTLLADTGLAGRLLDPLIRALAADPLFEPPLKVSRERGRIGAVLFDAPAARLTASILSVRALAAAPAQTVVVPGHVSVTRYVRAGGARIRRWRANEDRVHESAPWFPRDGDIAVLDGRDEGHVVAGAAGDMVTLTIVLRAHVAPTVREYRIADGALIRTASTDDGASRTAMLLTLLRVAGRSDASDAFAAATRDPAPHARWGAMREWLALDAMAALPRLAEMTDDADTEVRDVARRTHAIVTARRVACPA